MAETAPSGDVAQILLAAAEQDLAACEALAQVPGIVGLDRPKVLAALRALLQWTRAQLRGSA